MPLTVKDELFAQASAAGMSNKEAAIAAGCPEKTASAAGSRLAKKPEVIELIKQLKEGGTSILLVTHTTEQIVTHCSRAVLLDHGNVIEEGDSKRVVNCYLDLLFGKARKQIAEQNACGAQNLLKHSPSGHLNFDADVFSTRPGYNAL